MDKTFPRNPWWIVVAGFVTALVGNGPILTFPFGVFMKPLVDEFGIGRGTLGSFFFLQAILGAVAAPVFGALVDRYGTRPVMLPWIVSFGGLLILAAFTGSSFTAFLVVFLLLGPASQAQGPIGFAKAVTLRIGNRLGLALGLMAAGVGVGAALLPQFSRILIENYGWRGGYIGLGLAVLIIAIPMVATFARSVGLKQAKAVRADVQLTGAKASEAVRTALFWTFGIVILLTGAVVTGLNVSMVPLLTDRGFTLANATYVASTAGVATIFGRVLAGYLLDRIYGPYVGISFFVLPAIAIVLLNVTGAAWIPFACAFLIGMATGAEIDIIAYLTRRYFGDHAYGQIYGWYYTLFFAGVGLGPFLMGSSFQGLGTYLVAEIGFVVALGIACLLISRLGPYRYAPHATAKGAGLQRELDRSLTVNA